MRRDSRCRSIGRRRVPLVILHVSSESSSGIVSTVAYGALERLGIVVGLHVDLQMVTTAEGGFALGASVLLVASVQLYVTISAPFVLE